MKKHIVVILAGLLGLAGLTVAACDSDTPVPPTPLLPTPPTNIPSATATAQATRLVVIPSPTGAQSEWQLFMSTEGRFSVRMPGKPTESDQPIKDTLGDLRLKSFAAEDSGITYTLFYVDFPDTAQRANPSDLLNAALTRVEGTNTVTSQKKIDVQGNPGVQVEGENGNKGYMRYMAVLAKTRLYELIVLSPSKGVSTQEVTRFIDSFKLTSP